jgi:hypothetical protein
VSQVTQNAVGGTARVLLSGFSFHTIRDDEPADPIDRVEHLQDILAWLETGLPTPTHAAGHRFRYSLAQNYPNPFNPTTTINFTLKKRSKVTLKVFNVAGQAVKTLVSELKAPGLMHSATWDGTDNRGTAVASGVYFYKLSAGDFSQTKKMVLLK